MSVTLSEILETRIARLENIRELMPRAADERIVPRIKRIHNSVRKRQRQTVIDQLSEYVVSSPCPRARLEKRLSICLKKMLRPSHDCFEGRVLSHADEFGDFQHCFARRVQRVIADVQGTYSYPAAVAVVFDFYVGFDVIIDLCMITRDEMIGA